MGTPRRYVAKRRISMTSTEGNIQPKFRPGDQVFIRNQPDAVGAVIREPRRIADDWWYRVSFGARSRECPEASLQAYVGTRDVISLLKQNCFGPREALSKVVTMTKLKQPLLNNLYSYRASRTEFHEYQFKPLIKLLNSSHQRLLIADEVGLGKTIEAGFIYQELQARHNLDRVLIVCPSTLRFKWAEEMERRFGEEFEILDATGIRGFLNRVHSRGSHARLRGICSLQSLRSESMQQLMLDASPPFDMIIIDEAHHMRNPGTLSSSLGTVLSGLAETLLMLTATPIHLGSENLFNLLQIMDPEEFSSQEAFEDMLEANVPVIEAERILRSGSPNSLLECLKRLREVEGTAMKDRFLQSPIYADALQKLEHSDSSDRAAVIEIQRDIAQLNLLSHMLTRTRKREVLVNQPKRQAYVMTVDWSPEEKALYNTITEYCRHKIEEYGPYSSYAYWFPVITLQRQIASCLPATLAHYDATDSDVSEDVESSDLAIEDFTEADLEPSEFLRLRDDPEMKAILKIGAECIHKDSKCERLLQQLTTLDGAQPNRKILIFSYFKPTLKYLGEKLDAAGYRCVTITGDVPSYPNEPARDIRGQRLEQFRSDPGVRIMLSSEVGSEGLDFQFAHILINYDLPWNPMVVEQRIGRLDRLGQKSDRILIYNFSVPGTIEDRILQRLYDRIRIFEQSIGDLETILGQEIRDLTLDLLSSKLTPEEQERRIDDCAKVIERRRQDLAQLEEQSVQFIGHDEYFRQELEQISRNRRYITKEEMETIVSDFVLKEFPASSWQYDTNEGCFRFKMDRQLVDFIRVAFSSTEIDPFFVDRATRSPVRLTCDSDTSLASEAIEFVRPQHFLIQTIVRYYEKHPDRLHPVAAVEVRSTFVPSGDYVYLLYLIEQQSARPGKTLVPIFIGVGSFAVLPNDTSERLLSEMIVSSGTLGSIVLDEGMVDKVAQIADESIGEHIKQVRADLSRTNEDAISRKLASLDATHVPRRRRVQEQLDRAQQSGQMPPHYIRMLEGTIRNIDERYEEKRKSIAAGRQVDLQLDLFAGGVVRVINDE
jgi:superfamily II DNA or RNA helicase